MGVSSTVFSVAEQVADIPVNMVACKVFDETYSQTCNKAVNNRPVMLLCAQSMTAIVEQPLNYRRGYESPFPQFYVGVIHCVKRVKGIEPL